MPWGMSISVEIVKFVTNFKVNDNLKWYKQTRIDIREWEWRRVGINKNGVEKILQCNKLKN